VLAACRELRPEAAVLLMTGYPAVDGAVSALKNGAFDYLQKPVDPVVLAATLHRAINKRAIRSESLDYQDLVNILSNMVAQTIERVDPYTAGHGERTRKYCKTIAVKLGLDRRTTERLELAAGYGEALSARNAAMTFSQLGGGASAAGDFCWTYGEARWEAGGATHAGYYARVWQKRAEGWRIVFDELIPAPDTGGE